jgi:hypothetical protein
MTNEEKLFVRTIDELSDIIHTDDYFNVLFSSAHIRKLFLERNPLFVVVNKTYHLKIEFEYADDYNNFIRNYPTNILKPNGFLAIEGIDPYKGVSSAVVKVDKDKFFKTTIGSFDNKEYTIKDLIKFFAHIKGGVHVGIPESEIEKNLDVIHEHPSFSTLSLNILLQQMRVITKIILKALRPLQQEILKIGKFDNKLGIGVHLLIILYPEKDKKENFITDFGIEKNKNRLSVFVNGDDELCFRFFDNDGNEYRIIAGKAGKSFAYNIPMYIAFEITSHDKELFMSVDTGIWRKILIFKSSKKIDFINNLVFVMGSDYEGKATTNIGIQQYTIMKETLSLSQKEELQKYLYEKFKNENGYVRFEGNKFLYSNDHPNFPKKN